MNSIKEFTKKHPSALRYISIVVIVAILLPIIFVGAYAGTGGKYFALAGYLAIAILGAYEVLKNLHVHKSTALVMALVIAVMFFFPINSFKDIAVVGTSGHWDTFNLIKQAFSWKSILIVAVAPILLLLDKGMLESPSRTVVEICIAIVSLLLISIFAKFMWAITVAHPMQLFFFIPIAIIADSFGYFGGKYFKKYFWNGKKLAPKLSPKKTWAGFIIGYVFTAAFVGLAGWFMGIFQHSNGSADVTSIVLVVLMTFILPVISPMGDLLFSGIKRFLGIKDFSNLMPGHGGIMDRIDAMSAVIFILFLVFLLG